MTDFTDEELFAEASREVEQRHRVYGNLVRKGTMSKEKAKRQIDLMIAIKLHFQERVEAKPGPLFDAAPRARGHATAYAAADLVIKDGVIVKDRGGNGTRLYREIVITGDQTDVTNVMRQLMEQVVS